MKVVVARSAGFCYGVRRAVELAGEQAARGVPCVMLGSLIHNRDVTRRLAAQGLRVVDSPEEVPDGAAVIIRSHGESRTVHEEFARDCGNPRPSRGAGHRGMVQGSGSGFRGKRFGKMAGK